MKGLDLAELFFNEFGLPAIKEHFPEVVVRISAGRIGSGEGDTILDVERYWGDASVQDIHRQIMDAKTKGKYRIVVVDGASPAKNTSGGGNEKKTW